MKQRAIAGQSIISADSTRILLFLCIKVYGSRIKGGVYIPVGTTTHYSLDCFAKMEPIFSWWRWKTEACFLEYMKLVIPCFWFNDSWIRLSTLGSSGCSLGSSNISKKCALNVKTSQKACEDQEWKSSLACDHRRREHSSLDLHETLCYWLTVSPWLDCNLTAHSHTFCLQHQVNFSLMRLVTPQPKSLPKQRKKITEWIWTAFLSLFPKRDTKQVIRQVIMKSLDSLTQKGSLMHSMYSGNAHLYYVNKGMQMHVLSWLKGRHRSEEITWNKLHEMYISKDSDQVKHRQRERKQNTNKKRHERRWAKKRANVRQDKKCYFCNQRRWTAKKRSETQDTCHVSSTTTTITWNRL